VRPIERRTLLGCLLAAGVSCSRKKEERLADATPSALPVSARPPESAGPTDVSFEERTFDSSPVGPEKAMLIVPRWGTPGERFPVLVALHGRGEAVRGLNVGARGWLREYGIDRTIARLRSPPLTRDDFMGFVEPRRLSAINASLAERPFRGLVVACPWVPDVLNERNRGNLDAAAPFGEFVVRALLPDVTSSTPALPDRNATGIDGVSLGGRVALQVGLSHPDRFGAVGTLQAAVQDAEAQEISRRAVRAVADSASMRLRLLTSDRDYFRTAIETLHSALTSANVPHEHLVVVGPHDYVFNRGPGGIEMLLWHDRVLRGENPV
jgi:iron(III)-salmochelin esterase